MLSYYLRYISSGVPARAPYPTEVQAIIQTTLKWVML